MLVNNTPWEEHIIYDPEDDRYGWPVWVKREDLCCGDDPNSPSFSKMRGVAAHLESLEYDGHYPPIGVLDTYHSKAGRGVAWLCQQMGIPCYVFFPVYKAELFSLAGPDNPCYGEPQQAMPMYELRTHQRDAHFDLGAKIIPLKAGRSAILYHQAKKHFAELTDGTGYMLPNALKLSETVDATAMEILQHTPEFLYDNTGTWVVSISSGTIAAGVLKGIWARVPAPYAWPTLIAHLGYSRSLDAARKYIVKMADVDPGTALRLVDENYAYKDKVDNSDIPWPCNEFYDAKAFLWLMNHIQELTPPIVFFNIGA